MKKLLFLMITMILSVVVNAVDTELQDLVELTAIASADVLYVIDDPAGTPASRKITALNLFDMIDTFSELNTIVADKTLVNEEDAVAWDALGTFNLGITITTGDPFTLGTNRIDNGSDLLDGEMIGADTIDDDSIDWSDCTLADFDYETNWKMWHSDAAGDITEITLGADGTFLESNGAAAAPAFRVLVDGDIPNSITIDLATTATNVTAADESTDDTCFPLFVTAATGNLPPKTGTNLAFASSTGVLTATEFSGGGASLTAIDAATGDSATAFFDAGTIEHEWGGLEADINAYTGLVAITGGSTAEVDSKSELEGHIADVADFAEADGDVYTGNADFGGGDLELPQASPAVPDADGEIEVDFTDGKVVIQHSSAHAELGAATDVAMGTLIKSWGGTIIAPDGVNDVITVKAINSIEFPHGVVITAIYLGVSSDTNYTLTVQNFDDFDTINGANGTIDTVAYTADTTGEIIDTTPTYATIAAGQIIMISIPSTDVDWIHFEIYFYEPAA